MNEKNRMDTLAPETHTDMPFLADKLREAVTEGDDAYIFYAGKCREKIQLVDVIILERAVRSPSPAPQEHVSVKKLGWMTCGEVHYASTPFGSYEVRPNTISPSNTYKFELCRPFEKMAGLSFVSADEGKAVAQEDFKARILSCVSLD